MLTSALLCFASACAPQASPPPGGLAAVRAVFLRTEGATHAPDEVLVRRLAALGAEATPVLFDLATGLGLESFLGEEPDEAWLCAPDHLAVLTFAALAELPQVPVREWLRTRCSEQPERLTRVTALRVLGSQRTAAGLGLFLELCLECGEELAHPTVRLPAVEALRSLLTADDETLGKLEGPLLAAPPMLQTMACEALAGCGRADTVRLVTQLFGREPELDLAALEALATLGARYAWVVGDPVSARLRTVLERGDPRLRNAAARALGRTRDVQAVPQLIACLSTPDLARAAEWALREITGERRPQGEAAWQAWLERERAWAEEEAERHLACLDPRREASVTSAIRALLAHPLERERAASALASVLGDYEPGLAVTACGALAQLASRRAVPSLAELLFVKDSAVRSAAWQALRTLTGADLPAEPRLWEEYVAGL